MLQHRKDVYIVYDNNSSIDNEDNLINKRKKSCLLLQDLIVNFEEKLNDINAQINSLNNMIKEKEQERSEKERTMDHNLTLFSPIHNKEYDAKVLYNEIEQIQQQKNELTQEKANIEEKITELKIAVQCIDEVIKNSQMKSIENCKSKHSDKGLGILEAQEVERQRIARDLHDSTVQNLTSLVHKSELCIKLLDIDTIRAKLELNAMSNTLKIIINDMRGIIYNLKPMTLDDLGLTVTVQRYANRLMNLNNIQIKMTYNEEPANILPVIKLTVFRVIQEACMNIKKHAKATIVDINLEFEENKVNVTIQDNGIGFDLNHINKSESSSFGISIMKERISLLSGTLNIESTEKIGTIITINVPLEIQEEKNNE